MSEGIFKKSLIKKYIVAFSFAFAISLIFLLVSALLLLLFDDPDPYYRAAALTSLSLSALISGGVSAKIIGTKSSSAVIGSAMTILMFILSLIFFERGDSPVLSLILHITYVALFFAGGLLSKRKRNQKRRVRRRKKR